MMIEEHYQSMYHMLVRAIDNALTELENGENAKAQERLQAALLACEEMYLTCTDTP